MIAEYHNRDVPFVFSAVLPERTDEVKVKIKSPDTQGRIQVDFSRDIRLPTNVTGWTNENEGAEKFKILYKPTEGTKELAEDIEKELSFSW